MILWLLIRRCYWYRLVYMSSMLGGENSLRITVNRGKFKKRRNYFIIIYMNDYSYVYIFIYMIKKQVEIFPPVYILKISFSNLYKCLSTSSSRCFTGYGVGVFLKIVIIYVTNDLPPKLEYVHILFITYHTRKSEF